MKIIRHTARDMRQALRAVREQLGEDAVILSSRRTSEGVEVTAAVDFDASTLEAGGFASAPPAAAPLPSPPAIIDASHVDVAPANSRSSRGASIAPPVPTRLSAATRTPGTAAARSAAGSNPGAARSIEAPAPAASRSSAASALGATRSPSGLSATAFALTTGRAPPPAPVAIVAPPTAPGSSYHDLATLEQPDDYAAGVTFTTHAHSAYDNDLISEAAREAVVEHMAVERAPVLAPAPAPRAALEAPVAASRPVPARAQQPVSYADMVDDPVDEHDPVAAIREATLTPLASNEVKATFAGFAAKAGASAATDAMSDELKTLRRMLENQLAHLAWNDLTRRAPVHTEILRELTEIGITRDLAEHLVRQLPEDQDLTFARRFTIAGLSQYLKVTGDRWLDDGGRVAFVGATGVGKTTTLAKIAVRWVLRHGARDIALVAADPVRIGAQDQLRSLAQLLGVPVYTPESFEQLPALLSRLSERLILIDTPGSSARDSQLASRLAVLSNSASKLETALVLAASTQAGAIEETVRRFAPANPSCCVLTKLDEAASLGGVLSSLIRARMPVSYMSEGQRVPEDLRPARALELVSAAVRLAKARGAAADEDLLRRRFGKTAHGIS